MNNNEVEIIEGDIVDLTGSPQGNGGLLDTSSMDNLSYLAERADKALDDLNKIMVAALKITTELDWVLIGGNPYLQESGAAKVARLFGISWQIIDKTATMDKEGYKTFTYKARFMLNNQFIECEGSRGMKEDFFAKQGKDKPLKKPDEIDERDVQMSAYTNCINNGIKRIIPNLRNIDVATLEKAGLDASKIRGYVFKEGAKGGSSKAAEASGLICSKCGKAITQAEASYSQAKFGSMLCRNCQKGAAQ